MPSGLCVFLPGQGCTTPHETPCTHWSHGGPSPPMFMQRAAFCRRQGRLPCLRRRRRDPVGSGHWVPPGRTLQAGCDRTLHDGASANSHQVVTAALWGTKSDWSLGPGCDTGVQPPSPSYSPSDSSISPHPPSAVPPRTSRSSGLPKWGLPRPSFSTATKIAVSPDPAMSC